MTVLFFVLCLNVTVRGYVLKSEETAHARIHHSTSSSSPIIIIEIYIEREMQTDRQIETERDCKD